MEHAIIVWNLWELCGTCDNHMVRAGITWNVRESYITCGNCMERVITMWTCGNYVKHVGIMRKM
jgi:hypothetical protein